MRDDLIKRSDAIKAIEELPNAYNGWSDTYDKTYIISTLEEVPRAEEIKPQTDDKHAVCTGCMYYELPNAFHPCASCVDFSKYTESKDEPQVSCENTRDSRESHEKAKEEMMGEYYDAAGNFIGVRREFITVDKGAAGQIVQYHGAGAQKSKAVEELLELSEVLIKDINKHELNQDALYEELADVEIMLEQLMIIYNIDLEGLQQEVDRKISRTFDRMTLVPDCGWK